MREELIKRAVLIILQIILNLIAVFVGSSIQMVIYLSSLLLCEVILFVTDYK